MTLGAKTILAAGNLQAQGWSSLCGGTGWAAALLAGPGAPGGYWCKLRPETASAISLL